MQFISLTSQFLRGCAAHQIQLAPDQCEPSMWSWAAAAAGAAPPALPWQAHPDARLLPHSGRPPTRPPARTPPHNNLLAAVCSLCRKFREHLVSAGLMRLGILPLLAALERLRPSPEHLTPIHADAVLL